MLSAIPPSMFRLPIKSLTTWSFKYTELQFYLLNICLNIGWDSWDRRDVWHVGEETELDWETLWVVWRNQTAVWISLDKNWQRLQPKVSDEQFLTPAWFKMLNFCDSSKGTQEKLLSKLLIYFVHKYKICVEVATTFTYFLLIQYSEVLYFLRLYI
jgi:hypothetical protein